MKLSNLTSNQYIIVVDDYALTVIDTSRDDFEYNLSFAKSTTLRELQKNHDSGETNCIADVIEKDNEDVGEDIEEILDEPIYVYDGTVSETEFVTVYIISYWQ